MVGWMVVLCQAGVSVSFKTISVYLSDMSGAFSCAQIMFIFTMFLCVCVYVENDGLYPRLDSGLNCTVSCY